MDRTRKGHHVSIAQVPRTPLTHGSGGFLWRPFWADVRRKWELLYVFTVTRPAVRIGVSPLC